MNILAICHYGLYKDINYSFVHSQEKALSKIGNCVKTLVLTPIGKKVDGKRLFPIYCENEYDGVKVVNLRVLSLSNFGKKRLNTVFAKFAVSLFLDKITSDFKPHIINSHTLGFDSDVGNFVSQRLKIKNIVTVHGSDVSIPYNDGNIKYIAKKCEPCDEIVCVSGKLKNMLVSVGVADKVSVISNGFNFFDNNEEMSKNRYSMVFVGNLVESKRLDVTLLAFSKLLKLYPDMSLVIVGEGPLKEELLDLSNQLKIEDKVKFTGFLSNELARLEMRKSQFFVMPSHPEGFGIVYLEAMSEGCIPIGTQGEGISDVIKNGFDGFLIAADDVDAIVTSVDCCLKNESMLIEMSNRAKETSKCFTWENNAEKYNKKFEEIINGNSSSKFSI